MSYILFMVEILLFIFFIKQKTEYELSISDWSSDVCSSDRLLTEVLRDKWGFKGFVVTDYTSINEMVPHGYSKDLKQAGEQAINAGVDMDMQGAVYMENLAKSRSEEHTSELQSLMRISYAVFCLKKKT